MSSDYGNLPDLPARNGTLADLLCEALENAILDGYLPPGSRVRVGDLAERYGVSTIPVRESLRTLEANGWISLRPRHGAYVHSGSIDELHDLFESRGIIEPALAGLAATRRNVTELRRLETLVTEGFGIAERGDTTAFAKVNSDFHRVVAEAARNRTLLHYQQQLHKRVRFYFSGTPIDRLQSSATEHDDLVKAISESNSVAARKIALKHVQRTHERIERSGGITGGIGDIGQNRTTA